MSAVAAPAELAEERILVVDDEPANLTLLSNLLDRAGYGRVVTWQDAESVPREWAQDPPDLLILDLHMPRMDGFEVMEAINRILSPEVDLPYLVLTADVTDEAKRRALAAGARDFLTKPIDQTELLLRVRNLLHAHKLHSVLQGHNEHLEREVKARTRELEVARQETLDRLALASEFRDDDTQQHAQRIGRTAAMIAAAMNRPIPEMELIRRAAPLHDIGKVGVPDSILLKPGKLTPQEFSIVKTHTTTGAQILSGGETALIRLAEVIALRHHERWDGGGYPGAYTGEQIPLAARIVAVADVFDALTHDRPYKEAWPVRKAVDEIRAESRSHFDPAVVEAFMQLEHDRLLAPVRKRSP